MKETTLSPIHEELGAKMVPFAGFKMPVSYEGVNAEHQNVREKLGVFDVSHMGEFFITGKEALDFVQWISANDASNLEDGNAQYTYLPTESGGIVDDFIIYRINAEKYLLVVNASNIEKDFNWIQKQNSFDAQVHDESGDYSLLAIQGPKANEAMQKITPVNLSAMKMFDFAIDDFGGEKDVIISATGYTGSGGIEIYCKNNQVETIWNKVMEAGEEFGIKPIGLAARDTLRLEMGLCLYGNDIDEETSPIEAGLGWTTKFSKEFVNSQNLKFEKENGPNRRLKPFVLSERGIPRKGYPILSEDGEEIGEVTSGTMSPSLGKPIGLGYVKTGYHKRGTEIQIKIRKKEVPAQIVKLPFYKG